MMDAASMNSKTAATQTQRRGNTKAWRRQASAWVQPWKWQQVFWDHVDFHRFLKEVPQWGSWGHKLIGFQHILGATTQRNHHNLSKSSLCRHWNGLPTHAHLPGPTITYQPYPAFSTDRTSTNRSLTTQTHTYILRTTFYHAVIAKHNLSYTATSILSPHAARLGIISGQPSNCSSQHHQHHPLLAIRNPASSTHQYVDLNRQNGKAKDCAKIGRHASGWHHVCARVTRHIIRECFIPASMQHTRMCGITDKTNSNMHSTRCN